MVNLICFILTAYGLTNILCFAKILDSIRPKYCFFKCSMCMGFWVGIILWLLNFPLSFNTNLYLEPFFFGCLSSGTSYILCMLFADSGLNINKTFTKK